MEFVSAQPAITPDKKGLVQLADLLNARALAYERQRDSRCVFTIAYGRMTTRLADEFGTPEDIDWDWIALLAAAFGRRYILALDAADAGATPPPAWAHVFWTLKASRTSVLEDLLLPMTVHIVRDLPHALCDVGLAIDQRRHLREFHHVNDVMERSIDEMQELVRRRYGPFTAWLDLFAGGVDEILTNYGIRVGRATAWYNANRLLDPASADEATRSIERSPRILTETIMSPPLPSLAIIFRLLRLVASFFRRWPASRANTG